MGPLDASAKFLFLSVVSSFPLILYMAKEGGDYSTALLFVSPSLPMLITGNPFPAHVQRSFVVQKSFLCVSIIYLGPVHLSDSCSCTAHASDIRYVRLSVAPPGGREEIGLHE